MLLKYQILQKKWTQWVLCPGRLMTDRGPQQHCWCSGEVTRLSQSNSTYSQQIALNFGKEVLGFFTATKQRFTKWAFYSLNLLRHSGSWSLSGRFVVHDSCSLTRYISIIYEELNVRKEKPKRNLDDWFQLMSVCFQSCNRNYSMQIPEYELVLWGNFLINHVCREFPVIVIIWMH